MTRACIVSCFVLCAASVCLAVILSSCTVHAVNANEEDEMITLTGKLRLVGNEPFTHLVISTDDGRDYLIEGPLEEQLRALQYQMVTAKGKNLPPKGPFTYRIEVKEYSIIDRTH
jgi:hypothetical protein